MDSLLPYFFNKTTGATFWLNYELTIYNRWGQQVFYSNIPNTHWDGTLNGTPATIDVYYYHFRLQDIFGKKHNFSGMLHLMK